MGYLRRHDCGSSGDDHYVLNVSAGEFNYQITTSTRSLHFDASEKSLCSSTGRRKKSGERSVLGLFLSANKKYKHTHFSTPSPRTFLPYHPVPVSIVRCEVSLGTICRIVKVLPFGCILRHRRRSLQHAGTSKSKNPQSVLDWSWSRTPRVTNQRIPRELRIWRQEGSGREPVSNVCPDEFRNRGPYVELEME